MIHKITRIAHMGYVVRDLEASLRFYRDVMGLEHLLDIRGEDGQIALSYLRVTETEVVELVPRSDASSQSPASGPLNHLCFEVDDVHAVVQDLAARGVPICQWQVIEGLLQLLPAPTLADAVGEGIDGNRQAWLRDPEGNAIELMQMLPGNPLQRSQKRSGAQPRIGAGD